MGWEVNIATECEDWYLTLSQSDQEEVRAHVELLEESGPGLGRPAVDSIKGSRHHNMKELRPGTMRVLFCFDPRRQAILLIGGDKRDNWTQWYETAIPLADDLYDKYLEEIEDEL